jgi:hypothetical protein
MIAFSRALARQFRAVLRRSLLDKEPRGSWPLVLFQASNEGLVLQACQRDTAVRYHLDGSYLPEAIAFRASVLAELEGRRDDPVELEQVAFGKGQAKWVDGDVPKVIDLETVVPDSAPHFPDLPRRFIRMPREFLQALDEATNTAARESVRYALARLQLRGKTGEIIATDGRQLLVQGGFVFPWSDTVLVPRVPAFGLRELAQEPDVSLGRTKTHVAVRVGPWTFLLAIDTQSRFPNVEAVIPRAAAGVSRLHFDPQDAAFLAANLPKLPGAEDAKLPITLDLHAPISLRGRDEKHGITELVLNRSTVSGPPVRLCTDRRYLVRAVKLGFDKVEISSADKPLVCRADQRVYVWMPLDKTAVSLSQPGMQRICSAEGVQPPTLSEPERRETPMPTPQPNGHTPENGRSNGNMEPERWGIVQVIAETETLRDLLHDASARTGRLLAALKHQRRRSRAVQQAMQSLKDLQLDH